MKLILRDRNPEMAEAWENQFRGVPDVEIGCGDIFDVKADALVSPSNSAGFMNGGIDLAYSKRFGWGLQAKLQEHLRKFHDGELPVGEATVIPISDKLKSDDYQFLISAPTMRVPMDINGTVNAYLAFRAILRLSKSCGFNSILCPGLGTAVGRMPYHIAAFQMREAYRIVMENQPLDFHDIAGSYHYHEAMRRGLPYREPESVFGVKNEADHPCEYA